MKWIEKRIRNSKTGRQIVIETETRVANQMKDKFVVLAGKGIVRDTIIKIPQDKEGLLMLGEYNVVSGCYIEKEKV